MGTPLPVEPDRYQHFAALASIPEQLPGLMTCLSGGDAWEFGECMSYAAANWLIIVGYPQVSEPDPDLLHDLVSSLRTMFHPQHIWLVTPCSQLAEKAEFKLAGADALWWTDTAAYAPPPRLKRQVEKAGQDLMISSEREFTASHRKIVAEMQARIPLPPLVADLYARMPVYLALSEHACVFNARTREGDLCAFMVLDQEADRFNTYLLGGYSRRHPVPHASDLLMDRILSHTRQQGKPYLHLGLGVNPGIRRFKQKWGGQIQYPYYLWEYPPRVNHVSLLLDYLELGRR